MWREHRAFLSSLGPHDTQRVQVPLGEGLGDAAGRLATSLEQPCSPTVFPPSSDDKILCFECKCVVSRSFQ